MIKTARPTAPKLVLPSDSPALIAMNRYAEFTGLPIFCVEAETGAILGRSDAATLELIPGDVRRQLAKTNGPSFIALPGGLQFFSLPLPDANGSPVLAVGYALSDRNGSQVDVVLAAVEQGWSQRDIKQWWSAQTFCGPEYLKNLLETVTEQVEHLVQ